MKKVSIHIHDTTWDLILKKAISMIPSESLTGKGIVKKANQVILQTLMDAFPSEVLPCNKCGKIFSIEGDEGVLRETGTFCNKHVPPGEEG